MAIIKCLDLSTGHVPANFGKLQIPFRVVPHEYGWTVFLSDELDEDELKQLQQYKYLYKIYLYAVDQKCAMINFDADAEQYEDFKKFNW